MSSVSQVDYPRSSATFEFTSHFPNLHMPARGVADPAMVDPRKDACLFDGEIVQLTAEGKVETLVEAGTIKPGICYLTHGKPGRSDLQVAQAIPTVEDEDFHFRTKLVEIGSATVGDRFKPAVLTTIPPYNQHGGLVPASSGEEYVAILKKIEKNGWYVFQFSRGLVP